MLYNYEILSKIMSYMDDASRGSTVAAAVLSHITAAVMQTSLKPTPYRSTRRVACAMGPS